MASVHLFRDLSPEERQEGKVRTMQVVYTKPAELVRRAFNWLWIAMSIGMAVVVALIILVAILIAT